MTKMQRPRGGCVNCGSGVGSRKHGSWTCEECIRAEDRLLRAADELLQAAGIQYRSDPDEYGARKSAVLAAVCPCDFHRPRGAK